MYNIYQPVAKATEYYYNVNANTCDPFGADFFGEWCFGTQKPNAQNQVYRGSFKDSAGLRIDQWTNGDFTFEAIHDQSAKGQCLPFTRTRSQSKGALGVPDHAVYQRQNLKINADADFKLPAVCQPKTVAADVVGDVDDAIARVVDRVAHDDEEQRLLRRIMRKVRQLHHY
jgi:hypothetical protein